LELANTLAYYDTATITAVKSFIVQAPGGQKSNPYLYVVYFFSTRVYYKSVAAKNSCFPELVSNMCSSIVNYVEKSFVKLDLGPLVKHHY
jgi:hypothetical protein